LRALEDWMTHAVVKANDNSAGVDGRADLERVEQLLNLELRNAGKQSA
jgi:CMP-2-keto-3-deoxyoctulosonic acid synthetase